MKTDWDYAIIKSFWIISILFCLGCIIYITIKSLTFLTTKPPETITKCDTEKQVEFILKCIATNPDNTNQNKIIQQCTRTAKTLFCTEITK